MEMKSRRLRRIAAGVALAVLPALALTPGARADGLAGISGWEPVPNSCGKTSIFPVVISNFTAAQQQGSVTIAQGLSAQVQVFASEEDLMASPFGALMQGQCSRPEIMSAPEVQNNFTVNASDTTVLWVAAGGVDYNLIDNSHKVGFGGLPAGTPNASWYDFGLELNADESFVNWVVSYSWTGGTDTTNNQNGFNLVQCNTGGGNLVTSDTILTPYTRWSSSVQYGMNKPVCAAWFPTGSMLPTSSASVSSAGGSIVGSVDAIQYQPGFGQQVNMAGTFSNPSGFTGAQYVLQGGAANKVIPITYGAPPPSSTMDTGVYVVTNGNSWVIEGMMPQCQTLIVNFLGAGGTILNTINVPVPQLPACDYWAGNAEGNT